MIKGTCFSSCIHVIPAFFILELDFETHSKYLLVDPNEVEERCMDGKLIIGMNKHRELCMVQLVGNVLLLKDQVSPNYCDYQVLLWVFAKITKIH